MPKDQSKTKKTASPVPVPTEPDATAKPDVALLKKIPKGGANSANIPLGSISIKPGFNPRKVPGDITELKRNLRTHGKLTSPILVCPTAPGADTYYVVAGHRRFLCASELGWPFIAATVADVDIGSDEAYALAMSENSDALRGEMPPMDQAVAFKRLLATNGGTGSEAAVGAMCGYSTAHVKRILRLNDIPDSVKERVVNGDLNKMAALAFAAVPEEVRDTVAAKLGPGVTEADINRLVNEAKREARAASRPQTDDTREEGGPVTGKRAKGTSKAGAEEKTEQDSRHNTPIGSAPGQRAVLLGARDIRKAIARISPQYLNCLPSDTEDADEEGLAKYGNQLAALLWVVGTIPAIDTDSPEFDAAVEEIKSRLDDQDSPPSKPKSGKSKTRVSDEDEE